MIYACMNQECFDGHNPVIAQKPIRFLGGEGPRVGCADTRRAGPGLPTTEDTFCRLSGLEYIVGAMVGYGVGFMTTGSAVVGDAVGRGAGAFRVPKKFTNRQTG